ncbi:hypothetical protein [Leuconostoc pseudomesenteroides]|uniref:hypothetical protein n=1 Tax=Leuconostoc pseudomesenteroides TaxID=33968 RepID=UPI0039E90888
MKEKPVAYGVIADGRLVEIRYLRKYNPDKDYDLTPLYTRDQLQPTVEMTSHQKKNLLTMKENKFSLIEIVAEFDDGNLIKDFDEFCWFPMTEIQLVQAWLHPETIKIVDE